MSTRSTQWSLGTMFLLILFIAVLLSDLNSKFRRTTNLTGLTEFVISESEALTWLRDTDTSVSVLSGGSGGGGNLASSIFVSHLDVDLSAASLDVGQIARLVFSKLEDKAKNEKWSIAKGRGAGIYDRCYFLRKDKTRYLVACFVLPHSECTLASKLISEGHTVVRLKINTFGERAPCGQKSQPTDSHDKN